MTFFIFQGACLVLLVLHGYYGLMGDVRGSFIALLCATIAHLVAWAGLLLDWMDQKPKTPEPQENW